MIVIFTNRPLSPFLFYKLSACTVTLVSISALFGLFVTAILIDQVTVQWFFPVCIFYAQTQRLHRLIFGHKINCLIASSFRGSVTPFLHFCCVLRTFDTAVVFSRLTAFWSIGSDLIINHLLSAHCITIRVRRARAHERSSRMWTILHVVVDVDEQAT